MGHAGSVPPKLDRAFTESGGSMSMANLLPTFVRRVTNAATAMADDANKQAVCNVHMR